jgi:RNA polymerase-binding protein DksA
MNGPERDDWRVRLLSRKAELIEHARQLRQEIDGVVAASANTNLDDEHDPEGATVAFESAQLRTVEDNVRTELIAVTHALERLEQGDYERCERCGQPIGAERLRARPTTTLCISCASRS